MIHIQDFSISHQNYGWLLSRSWQVDPKIHMDIQRIQNSWNNLEKEESEKFLFPDFKIYYNKTVIITVWYTDQ